jgi:lipopolysaccharide/colanic/teichoic acid biosynthesis glycosyltransferase
MKLYIFLKRTLDFVFAFILFIVMSPIMVTVAVLIKLDSKGPVFFRQRRPGKKGRVFLLYKFRTMRLETNNNGVPLTDMQRMTKVGGFLRKTSIDELPQLLNILKGEMSFIGPRPLLIEYLQYYTLEQMQRHDVTPGISGWAQVNGRNTISWEEKFTLDVWYVNHISLSLDFKILLLTITNVLKRSGINNSTNNTMPLFSEVVTKSSNELHFREEVL